jgi:hypothetical protein
VPAVNPVRVTECVVTSEAFRADIDSYAVLVPNSTCELEGWSVAQVMVAVVVVMEPEATDEMTGVGTTAAGVENVRFAEVADPPESAEITA